MLTVIVTCHGDAQADNLCRMGADAFAGSDQVVVVLSKTTRINFPFRCAYVVPGHRIEGFDAGANRDDGLATAQLLHPGTDALFLDGDCNPSPTWLASHRVALESETPTVTCGARTEDDRPDPRTLPLSWNSGDFAPSLFAGHNYEPAYRETLAHRATWSCNLGINRAALERIQSAGEVLHGCRRVFSPEFDGTWGGEDTGLGIVAHLTGCRVLMLDSETSSVAHQRHDRFHTTRRNLDLIPAYAAQVSRKLRTQTASGNTPSSLEPGGRDVQPSFEDHAQ